MQDVIPFENIPYVDPSVRSDEAAVLASQSGQQQQTGNFMFLQVGSGAKAFKVDPDGMWLGSDIMSSAPFSVDMLGNVILNSVLINGLSGQTLAGAFDENGFLISALITSTLDTQAKQILGEFTFVGSGALAIKTDADNGIWLSPTGILAKKAGANTFALDIAGNATFSGTLTAASGSLGAITIGNNAWKMDSSGNMWWGASANYAGATIKISAAGAVNFTSGTFSGTVSGATITGGTITGAVIQSATTGARVVINGTALYFYINDSLEGYIVPDGIESMIYSSDRFHRFFKNDGTWMGEISVNGMNLASGKSYNFASGRGITDLGSALRCNGDFVPSSDETGGLGYSNRKWDNIYANKVWQSTNTNGSRQVYDFAYIEMNLLPKRLINLRTKKGVMMTNGYVPGLELPFKQGTVLKWGVKGLSESSNQNDFAVAVADEKGLPIVLGAEPVRIIGRAKIGDVIIPSKKKGCAMAIGMGEVQYQSVIGRCLKNKSSIKEELILVMIK